MILEKLRDLELESINRGIPIIGGEKGKFLLKKVNELKHKRILELGTANGYSGIILGSNKSKLTTIELNKNLAKEAFDNFKKFNINAKVIIGDGVKEIKKFKNDNFDLVFIDFAKNKYLEVLEDSIRVLSKNGYLIADNMSFQETQNFKNKVLTDRRLKTKIINIKDGLSFSIKIRD